MEGSKCRRSYVRKKQSGSGRCSSPVPSAPPTGTRSTRPLLMGTLYAKRTQVKHTGKALPNIMENFRLNEMESISVMQNSNENSEVAEHTLSKTKEENISRTSVTHRTESVCSNSETKIGMKTGATSGISIPTGVSSYLLDCLNSASISESTVGSSSLTMLPSPETFRIADEYSGRWDMKSTMNTESEHWLKYKNSTLLDTSNAKNIDLLPQMSNLSAITGPSLKNEPGDKSEREQHLADAHLPAGRLSTTIAGKTVCKIMATREKTPTCLQRASHLVPARPDKKINESHSAKSKNSRCKKKVQTPCLLGIELPACTQPVGDEFSNTSTMVSLDKQPENVQPINESCSAKSKNSRCKKKVQTPCLLGIELPDCTQPVRGEFSNASTMVSLETQPENVTTQPINESHSAKSKNSSCKKKVQTPSLLGIKLPACTQPVRGEFSNASTMVSLDTQPEKVHTQPINESHSAKSKNSRCKKKVQFTCVVDKELPACSQPVGGEFSNASTMVSLDTQPENVNTQPAQKYPICSIIRIMSEVEPSQPRPAPYTGKKIKIPKGVPIDFLLTF